METELELEEELEEGVVAPLPPRLDSLLELVGARCARSFGDFFDVLASMSSSERWCRRDVVVFVPALFALTLALALSALRCATSTFLDLLVDICIIDMPEEGEARAPRSPANTSSVFALGASTTAPV